MAILFQQTEQIKSLQGFINQNNDIYAGKTQLILNMDKYYDGLELDTQEKKLARWKRAPKYLYYPKVVSSFTSSIYKKPPQYVLPLTDEELANVDLLGNNLNEYTAQIPTQVLKQGFCATIIDYSDKLQKPYFIFIKPEQFVSIQIKYDKGYPELSQFIYSVMEERQDEVNEFKLNLTKVHYAWDLDGDKVRVRKYKRVNVEPDKTKYEIRKDKTTQEDVIESTIYPVAGGNNLDKLPIIIHGQETNNYTVEKSVLQDVSDLNIDLMNRVVDQIEVLHLTAMPTPFIVGADPNDPDIPTTIGSSKLWILGDSDAKVGLIEFNGKSADAHRDYIQDLVQAMATSGAQILKQGGISRETATSVLIRTGQETAVITSIVQNISSQVEEILKVYCYWLGKKIDKIEYRLNSDFVSVDMEPNAQIALVRSWLDGAISHKSMFKKMKQGELIASDKSFEEEIADINKYPPPFPAKEKDAELTIKTTAAEAKITEKQTGGTTNTNPNNDQNASPKTKGSSLETGNEVKNTEIKD